MVKKQLASGEPCEKCAQAEEMLKRRGHWDRIDEIVWVVENDPTSPGAVLADRHAVKLAPFFIVRGDDDEERIYTSALRLARDCFPQDSPHKSAPAPQSRQDTFDPDPAAAADRLAAAEPDEILRWGLERYGEKCGIAFSGAEDIVLIDMAIRSGLPFSVFTIDTGRLHEETYAYFEEMRRRFGVEVRIYFPDAEKLTELVQRKGPNSFLKDGHQECCRIRRFDPLRRALLECEAWVTAKRRDTLSPEVTELPAIEEDSTYSGDPAAKGRLIRLNPLAGWSHARVWEYIRAQGIPCNPLHERGFPIIGCEPCTRATGGVHGEREARWWWEKDKPLGTVHESGDGI